MRILPILGILLVCAVLLIPAAGRKQYLSIRSLSRKTSDYTQTRPMSQRPVPDVLYGVTLEDVQNLNRTQQTKIIASLQHLHTRPAVRIVFDFNKHPNAENYSILASEVYSNASAVVGEILDSAQMSKCDVPCYTERTAAYLDALGDHVDIWEVGNEVNGNWLRHKEDSSDPQVIDLESKTIAEKIYAATKLVKDKGGKTALTLYYNERCWKFPQDEMFSWTEKYIIQYLEQKYPNFKLRENLDYVLISYYEDDCNDLQPDWPKVFTRLSELFIKPKIGFGECGAKKKPLKQEQYLRRYYVEHHRKLQQMFPQKYAGGYFWWWFRRDMVPFIKDGKVNPLWKTFDDITQ